MIKYNDAKFIESMSVSEEAVKSHEYPFSVKSIRHLKNLHFHKNVTYIIGENGTGKSTILEALAVSLGFNPEGGSRNFMFSTRHSHSDLYKFIQIKKGLKKPKDYYYLRAESFYNVATNIEELDREAEAHGGYGKPIKDFFGGKSLHEMSHGESFFTLINERFIGNGLYLLDEPEAALSPDRQMAMISRIHDLCKQGSQFIIATHSPILLAYPNSVIYSVEDSEIQQQAYDETTLFKTTKNFLNNYQSILKILME